MLECIRRHFFPASLAVLFVVVFINVIGQSEAEKEIPSMKKFGLDNVGGPTLSFFYCYSCGYRKAFEEYVNILAEKYPDLSVQGDNYDPPGLNTFVQKAISVGKMIIIMIIIGSFRVFGFQLPIPRWGQWCVENKLYSCILLFFVGNTIERQLMASGAFEISLNDVPIWSKLETGRIPAPQELFQIIESHLQFTDKLDRNPDFVK